MRVWNKETGELVRTLEGPLVGDERGGGGAHVVSGSDDETVRVWNKETGELVRTLEGHSGW